MKIKSFAKPYIFNINIYNNFKYLNAYNNNINSSRDLWYIAYFDSIKKTPKSNLISNKCDFMYEHMIMIIKIELKYQRI